MIPISSENAPHHLVYTKMHPKLIFQWNNIPPCSNRLILRINWLVLWVLITSIFFFKHNENENGTKKLYYHININFITKVKWHNLNLADFLQIIFMRYFLFYLEVKDRIYFLSSLLYFIRSLSLKSLEKRNRIAVTFGIHPI